MANALPQFFAYLVGPSEVKLSKATERNVLEAVEAIEFAYNISVEQNKLYRMLHAFKESLSDFIQIAIRYRNPRIFRKALKILGEIRQSTQTVHYKGDKTMPKLTREIDALRLDIQRELTRAKLRWKV